MHLVMKQARAYVYSGQWVADCPRDCGNVEYLFELSDPLDKSAARTGRRTTFYCSYCHQIADIEWSPNEAEIMAALERRPIPHTRNWYPPGHDVALRFGLPHGQTTRDLLDENAEHGVS